MMMLLQLSDRLTSHLQCLSKSEGEGVELDPRDSSSAEQANKINTPSNKPLPPPSQHPFNRKSSPCPCS